jgi:hypothetical protein
LKASAQRLAEITGRAASTELSVVSIPAYTGKLPPPGHDADGQDEGLSVLDPSAYLRVRVADQLRYYTGKTAKLERQLRRLDNAIFLIGGIGTLLAAANFDAWIALTAAMAAAVTTYLEYQQVEQNLGKYNQARSELESIRSWWQGLLPNEHNPANFRTLVTRSEQVLETELGGWVRRMQDSVELRGKHEAEPQS